MLNAVAKWKLLTFMIVVMPVKHFLITIILNDKWLIWQICHRWDLLLGMDISFTLYIKLIANEISADVPVVQAFS